MDLRYPGRVNRSGTICVDHVISSPVISLCFYFTFEEMWIVKTIGTFPSSIPVTHLVKITVGSSKNADCLLKDMSSKTLTVFLTNSCSWIFIIIFETNINITCGDHVPLSVYSTSIEYIRVLFSIVFCFYLQVIHQSPKSI